MFPQEKFSMFSSSCHSGITWSGSHCNSRISEFHLRFWKFWTPNCSSESKNQLLFHSHSYRATLPTSVFPNSGRAGHHESLTALSCQLLFRSTNLHKGKFNISITHSSRARTVPLSMLLDMTHWKNPHNNHCRTIRGFNDIPDLSLFLFLRQASTFVTSGACFCCHWCQRQTLHWLAQAQSHYYGTEQSWGSRVRIFLGRITVHSWTTAPHQWFHKITSRVP